MTTDSLLVRRLKTSNSRNNEILVKPCCVGENQSHNSSTSALTDESLSSHQTISERGIGGGGNGNHTPTSKKSIKTFSQCIESYNNQKNKATVKPKAISRRRSIVSGSSDAGVVAVTMLPHRSSSLEEPYQNSEKKPQSHRRRSSLLGSNADDKIKNHLPDAEPTRMATKKKKPSTGRRRRSLLATPTTSESSKSTVVSETTSSTTVDDNIDNPDNSVTTTIPSSKTKSSQQRRRGSLNTMFTTNSASSSSSGSLSNEDSRGKKKSTSGAEKKNIRRRNSLNHSEEDNTFVASQKPTSQKPRRRSSLTLFSSSSATLEPDDKGRSKIPATTNNNTNNIDEKKKKKTRRRNSLDHCVVDDDVIPVSSQKPTSQRRRGSLNLFSSFSNSSEDSHRVVEDVPTASPKTSTSKQGRRGSFNLLSNFSNPPPSSSSSLENVVKNVIPKSPKKPNSTKRRGSLNLFSNISFSVDDVVIPASPKKPNSTRRRGSLNLFSNISSSDHPPPKTSDVFCEEEKKPTSLRRRSLLGSVIGVDNNSIDAMNKSVISGISNISFNSSKNSLDLGSPPKPKPRRRMSLTGKSSTHEECNVGASSTIDGGYQVNQDSSKAARKKEKSTTSKPNEDDDSEMRHNRKGPFRRRSSLGSTCSVDQFQKTEQEQKSKPWSLRRNSLSGSNHSVTSIENKINVHDYISDLRTQHGLSKFSRNMLMDTIAKQVSKDLAASNGTKCTQTNYYGNVGQGESVSTILETMTTRKGTAKENILNPYFKEFGLGMTKGKDGLIYMCQVFK